MQINQLTVEAAKKVVDGSIAEGSYSWTQAFDVTVSGFAIVFAMLLLLVIVILVFGKVMNNLNHKEKPPKEARVKIEKKMPVPKVSSKTSPPQIASEDDEIIAVIAAAVNAMYEGTGKKPVIRAIRQAKSTRTAWASAGIFENTRAF